MVAGRGGSSCAVGRGGMPKGRRQVEALREVPWGPSSLIRMISEAATELTRVRWATVVRRWRSRSLPRRTRPGQRPRGSTSHETGNCHLQMVGRFPGHAKAAESAAAIPIPRVRPAPSVYRRGDVSGRCSQQAERARPPVRRPGRQDSAEPRAGSAQPSAAWLPSQLHPAPSCIVALPARAGVDDDGGPAALLEAELSRGLERVQVA
jgi:hypothetical protein